MWIEIFKKGNHTDSSGKKINYTDDDINEIVNKYNLKVKESDSFEAPIVKGHPGSDEPAFGWVERLQKKGDVIIAKLKDVTPELMKEIRDGRFKKVSVALYSDNMLRHVGLLGAMPPAIKGLKNVSFNENNYLEINQLFNKDDLNNEVNELILFNEELKEKYNTLIMEKKKLFDEINSIKNKEFIVNIKTKGKINDSTSECIINLFSELNEIDNSNKLINNIKEIILNLVDNKLNNNYYDKINLTTENKFSEFQNVNKDRLHLHEKTIEILNANPTLTYEDALLLTNK